MIRNGGGFFGLYPKPDSLDTWSEAFLYYGSEKSEYSQPAVTRNNFNTYSSCLTTAAHLYGHF